MADGDFSFSNIFDLFTGAPSAPTPDQLAMQQQQGYYYRPDAIQPNNAPWAQPQGYQNLTPDQIQAVQQQGYYTGGGMQPKSMWDTLAEKLGAPGTGDALKKITDQMGGKPAALGPSGAPLPGYPQAGNPYLNIYRRLSLDPKLALKSLMGGNLY